MTRKPRPWAINGMMVAEPFQGLFDKAIEVWPLWQRGSVHGVKFHSPVGVLTNGAQYALKGPVPSLLFDGDDDYVEFGTIPVGHDLQLNFPHTVLAYAYKNVSGSPYDSYQRLLDKSTSTSPGGAQGYSLYHHGADTLTYQINGYSPSSLAGVNRGQWHAHFGLYNGTNLWCYVPGIGASTPSGTTTSNVAAGLRFGTWATSTGREWNGYIAMLAFFRGVLSETEMDLIGHDPFGLISPEPRRVIPRFRVPAMITRGEYATPVPPRSPFS